MKSFLKSLALVAVSVLILSCGRKSAEIPMFWT